MRRLIGLLSLIPLLVGGCAEPARPSVSVTADAFPPTQQVESLILPFDAYSPSLATLYTISNAQDRLIQDCMKAAGLEWKIIARPMTVKDLRNRRRYGVIEMPIAQDFGYHVPPGLLTPITVEKLYDARENSLSRRQKDAAYGDNGCAIKATQQMQAKPKVPTEQLTNLDRASLADSQREPGVAVALKAWRKCMGDLDQNYQDPLAAISDARWWADESADPSAEEKAVAVADVGCKEQSGLVDAWYAAEVQIQQELIRQNANYFQKLKNDLDRESTDARAVLVR